MNLMSSTLLLEDTTVPFDELQAEQIAIFRDAWARRRPRARAARLGEPERPPDHVRPRPAAFGPRRGRGSGRLARRRDLALRPHYTRRARRDRGRARPGRGGRRRRHAPAHGSEPARRRYNARLLGTIVRTSRRRSAGALLRRRLQPPERCDQLGGQVPAGQLLDRVDPLLVLRVRERASRSAPSPLRAAGSGRAAAVPGRAPAYAVAFVRHRRTLLPAPGPDIGPSPHRSRTSVRSLSDS